MAALSTDDAKGGSDLESKGGEAAPPPLHHRGLLRTPLAPQTPGSNMGLVILQKNPTGSPASFAGLHVQPYQHLPPGPQWQKPL